MMEINLPWSPDYPSDHYSITAWAKDLPGRRRPGVVIVAYPSKVKFNYDFDFQNHLEDHLSKKYPEWNEYQSGTIWYTIVTN